MKQRTKEIISLLQEVIPNPVCELNFSNNYELLCAVLLSAQTTDKRVNMVTPELFERYRNYNELRNASLEDVIRIIQPLGLAQAKSKHLLSLAHRVTEVYDGKTPDTLEDLTTLSGVGRKTASVVLALGFHIPAFPVDTHVARIAKRLEFVKDNDDVVTIENKLKMEINREFWIEMHHLMLLFGRYHCTAKKPSCVDCKLKYYCKIYKKVLV